MDEKIFWLAWQLLLPGSSAKIWLLVQHFGSLKAAWSATDNELLHVLGNRKISIENLLRRRNLIEPDKELEKLNKKGIEFIDYHDAAYPSELRTIFDPPPGLFVIGKLKQMEPAVAIVGSRRATNYGLKMAERLGRELAEVGVTINSGMARGIDTAAHKGVLSVGGYTVAVLGCGVDVIYPPENGKIMHQIASSGAVISEFPPGSPPEAWHFPVRNRIISGLSQCVVVVEAAERSGALITADVALEQGRDVAAVPGNVTSRLSKGPNGLIKQGARLVENAMDILEELGIGNLFHGNKQENNVRLNLSASETKIFDILCSEPMHLEEIIQRAGYSPGEVLSLLMYLEVKGFIKQLPGKMFVQDVD